MKNAISYPSLEQANPLIVVGPARSGTRFMVNVLNCVPGVILQGEIENSVMRAIQHLVQQCETACVTNAVKTLKKNWDGTERDLANKWDATKRDFMFSAWANLTKLQRKECNSPCLYYGYKTPWHETYFDFYNSFFYPIMPKYICCVRSFIHHYLSITARWPERSIRMVAKRYVRSLRQIRYMKKQRPQDVLLFFLDDYKDLGVHYLRNRVFDPLGLKDVADAERTAAEGPVNSSSQLGLQKKHGLTARQKLFLWFYPHPLREFEALRRDFG